MPQCQFEIFFMSESGGVKIRSNLTNAIVKFKHGQIILRIKHGQIILKNQTGSLEQAVKSHLRWQMDWFSFCFFY